MYTALLYAWNNTRTIDIFIGANFARFPAFSNIEHNAFNMMVAVRKPSWSEKAHQEKTCSVANLGRFTLLLIVKARLQKAVEYEYELWETRA